MKKIALIFTFLFCAILFAHSKVSSQDNPSAEWIRVRSDDGEFSIEVPAKHDYFYDKEGFYVSKNSNSYRLEKMSMLNAFHDGALLSFESYKGKKSALEAVYKSDKMFSKNAKTSSFNRGGASIKQVTAKTDKYFYISQYFHSKSNVYILTVASRNSENATMKRFLDSLFFNPDTIKKPNPNSILFSSLKVTPVDLFTVKKDDKKDKTIETDKNLSDSDKAKDSKFTIVKKTAPVYTDAARTNGVNGTIEIKATFNENGFVPKINLVKSLPDGLLRQAVFAALRIKFLPEEKEGKTVSTTKTIEYSFTFY